MRRIVYRELAKAFLDLDGLLAGQITAAGEPILHRLRITVFRNICAYDGEVYMKQNPAIFYQLEEGEILTWIYHWFHNVDAGSEGRTIYGLAQIRGPLSFFSDCYRKYPAIKKWLKEYVPASDFEYIDGATKRYKHSYSFQELADSGMVEIVDQGGTQSPPSGMHPHDSDEVPQK